MSKRFITCTFVVCSRCVAGFSPPLHAANPLLSQSPVSSLATDTPSIQSCDIALNRFVRKPRRIAQNTRLDSFAKQRLSALKSKVTLEDKEVAAVEPIYVDDEFNDTKNNCDEEIDSSFSSETEQLRINTQLDPSFTPILVMCFLVTLLSALDRVAMSIAIISISDEYAFSETIKGNIASAVSYGYGLAILPIGVAVSVVSSRVLMMGGVALWSLATLGTPLMAELSNAGATTFLLPLLAVRGVMGAAEAVVLPTMQRVLANWVPAERKASILGTILAGFQVGTLGAYIVSPIVMDAMREIDGSPDGIDGWRGLFYVYGLLGLLWMVPWWLLARDAPGDSNRLSTGEDCQVSLINSMVEDDASLVLEECDIDVNDKLIESKSSIDGVKSLLQSAPWGDFVKSKGVWAMTLAHAAKNWELYNLLAWTPTFFSEHYGLNVKESALFSVVPSICGMVGGMTAGNVADYVLIKLEEMGTDRTRNVEKRTQVRKFVQSIALLGPAVCLYSLSNLPEEAATAQYLLGGAVGMQAFDVAGFGAATQDKAGSRWSGLLYSLTSLPGVLIGSLSVSVTGKILDAVPDGTGWVSVFQLNAAICTVGALCFAVLYDSKKEFE